MESKMCHECFKHKPLDNFKLVSDGTEWLPGNYCEECWDEPHYHVPVKPPLKDFGQMEYIIGFMGKKSYKEICKVFRIKYQKKLG